MRNRVHWLHTPFSILHSKCTEVKCMFCIIRFHRFERIGIYCRRCCLGMLRCSAKQYHKEQCQCPLLKFSRSFEQFLEPSVGDEKTPKHTNSKQQISKIGRQCARIMVNREYRSKFIRIIGRLEETVVSVIKHMVHVDVVRHGQILLFVDQYDFA